VPVRFIQKSGDQKEIVPALSGRAFGNRFSGDIDFNIGYSLLAGYNVFLGSKFKSRNIKMFKNYLGLKAAVLQNLLGLRLGLLVIEMLFLKTATFIPEVWI